MNGSIRAPGHIGVAELTVPADPRFARVARAAAVSCATVDDASVEDLFDLRLLVDEAFHALLCLGSGDITIALSPVEGGLALALRSPCQRNARWGDHPFEMLHTMLAAMCVRAEVGIDDETAWFEAEVRRLGR